MQTPSICRMVVFTLAPGVNRPAVITNLHGEGGIVDLQVFTAPGDTVHTLDHRDRIAHVPYHDPYSIAGGEPQFLTGTWHWPVRS